MRLKKVFLFGIVLMIFAVSFALAACGSDDGTDTTGDQDNGSGQQAGFTEYPIGDEVQVEGLNIAAVYFQPVQMEPSEMAGLGINEADIHIEADIHALKNNQTGFGFGEWIPFLTVNYQVKNMDNSQEQSGSFMPMNASDGPHYGANIKMMGAGKYKLTFIIDSPEKQGYLLHVDEETGVPGTFWNKPIEVSWDFNYIPRKF